MMKFSLRTNTLAVMIGQHPQQPQHQEHSQQPQQQEQREDHLVEIELVEHDTPDFLHKKLVHCGSDSPQDGAESEGVHRSYSIQFTDNIATQIPGFLGRTLKI